MTLSRTAGAAFAGAALVAAAIAVPMSASTADPAVPTLPTTGLNILLTNDDGWQALGINAVRDALIDAGHTVTLVAPATNQSGVGAGVSFSGTLQAVEQSAGIWSVDKSPVTSLLFGMEQVLDDVKPDLVISGTNVGANTGFDTNYSGTVGAATVAAGMYDLPAIAISTDILWNDPDAGAFAETSALLVKMIKAGVPDLPRGQFINVNYPLLNADRTAPVGIKFASTSPASAAAYSFTHTEDTTYKIIGARGTEAHPAGSDAALLKEGYVTVGVLDTDRSLTADQVPSVTKMLKKLPEFEAPPVVTPPAVKVTVQKLPKKVVRGTSQLLRATGADGTTLRVTWKTGGKKGKTTTNSTKISDSLFKFKAPKKSGKYKVTVTTGGKKIRTGLVKVL